MATCRVTGQESAEAIVGEGRCRRRSGTWKQAGEESASLTPPKGRTQNRAEGPIHEVPVAQAVTLPPGLDGLLRYLRTVPRHPGNRRLDQAAGADVLLETVATVPHQGSGVTQTRYPPGYRHPRGPEQKRPVGDGPKTGRPVRYDQPMAEGTRSHLCQRTVGENPLPGYGPVTL